MHDQIQNTVWQSADLAQVQNAILLNRKKRKLDNNIFKEVLKGQFDLVEAVGNTRDRSAVNPFDNKALIGLYGFSFLLDCAL